jgi:hypothetical protein
LNGGFRRHDAIAHGRAGRPHLIAHVPTDDGIDTVGRCVDDDELELRRGLCVAGGLVSFGNGLAGGGWRVQSFG